MHNFDDNKPRKSKNPYRRHDKHKSASVLEPEAQKVLEELPSWMQRRIQGSNLH
ncbi:uncharacterized protein METZ01_LOCUS381925 [marine metagenome]|uniref:Uncharacterized protein n=1 Tax=marine metagenome TaxID=408172 RepID=A0A382U5L3_9ZZZZ